MNDFEGLLATNYGFKSSSKSTPMAPPKSSNSSSSSSSSFNLGNFGSNNRKNDGKLSNSLNFDSLFGGGGDTATSPVFDKPVFDDDVVSSSYDASTKSGGGGGGGDVFDDLLGGLGKKETLSSKSKSMRGDSRVSGFDDLLPGFGGVSSINRSSSDATKKSSSVLDDPFVVLESTSHHVSSSSGGFRGPLEEVGNLDNLGSKNFENSSSGGVFDDIGNLNNSASKNFSTKMSGGGRDESPLHRGSRVFGSQTSVGTEGGRKSSFTSPERGSERKVRVEDFGGSPHSVFEMPSASAYSNKSVPKVSSPVYENTGFRESNSSNHVSPPPEQNMGSFDEVWLTVSEIPLFTQPTAAPPPSRSPPPRPGRFSRAESGSFPASNAQRKVNENSSFHGPNQYFHTPKSAPAGATSSFVSSLDELEEFAAGRNQSNFNDNSEVRSAEDFDRDSVAAASAAAMKEAMDRAEAKFRYAKGVRERESSKAFRGRESATVENAEKADAQDREFGEGQVRQQRDTEEINRRQKEEEDRRRIEKEREEKEKEKRRVERERELARQAVDRAAREARERAAIEARRQAERAAVQKANAEARERAERTAVQRVQAEARERAAAMARERAEKTAAEEREKARSEAQEKEAREKAAAVSKAASQQNDPDFESIFGVGSRASSAPRPRTTSSSKPAPNATRTSVNSASTMRKASSSTSIVDDLTSIFGEAPSSENFQDVTGETDERRRARLERQQRTQERAAKALAEKNARDLEAQREQAERHRISETLDVEIKRWAAGKEGNLRALLSTLQYVLWPECGWQPISLTDLITAASVKKAYRKATLCIHPDKVQQKGANLQQKYVAEKVFDMLKEAWNKFNSEELF